MKKTVFKIITVLYLLISCVTCFADIPNESVNKWKDTRDKVFRSLNDSIYADCYLEDDMIYIVPTDVVRVLIVLEKMELTEEEREHIIVCDPVKYSSWDLGVACNNVEKVCEQYGILQVETDKKNNGIYIVMGKASESTLDEIREIAGIDNVRFKTNITEIRRLPEDPGAFNPIYTLSVEKEDKYFRADFRDVRTHIDALISGEDCMIRLAW